MPELIVPNLNAVEAHVATALLHRLDISWVLPNIEDLEREHAYEEGWSPVTGNPEIYRHSDKLLVQGGKLIDIGSGNGRSSMPLLFQGMNVYAMDHSPALINEHVAIASLLRKINPTMGNLHKINNGDYEFLQHLPSNYFDSVLCDESFNHLEDPERAIKYIAEAIRIVKPGGYLWLRATGVHDEPAWSSALTNQSEYGAIGKEWCSCSGETRLETTLYLNPFIVMRLLYESGLEIIDQQMLPHFEGGYNTEIGNTHAIEVEVTQHGPKMVNTKPEKRQRGFITVLARKRNG